MSIWSLQYSFHGVSYSTRASKSKSRVVISFFLSSYTLQSHSCRAPRRFLSPPFRCKVGSRSCPVRPRHPRRKTSHATFRLDLPGEIQKPLRCFQFSCLVYACVRLRMQTKVHVWYPCHAHVSTHEHIHTSLQYVPISQYIHPPIYTYICVRVCTSLHNTCIHLDVRWCWDICPCTPAGEIISTEYWFSSRNCWSFHANIANKSIVLLD